MVEDGGGVGGGGDDGDGAGREGGAGGEVGGGVGGGGGDEWPSTLRVEKVGMTGLATAVTRGGCNLKLHFGLATTSRNTRGSLSTSLLDLVEDFQ